MHSLKRFGVVVLLLPLLAGCDGRGGSSGLDVVNENAAITRALDTRRCLDFEELTICPTDEPATSSPSIDTALANATSVDCFQSTPGASCTITLNFTARSFPANITFRVLGRPDASSNAWLLGGDPVLISSNEPPTYEATLTLSGVQGGPPNQVQLAILAFSGSATSPTEVEELHQTAATIAFVTQVLTIDLTTPMPPPTPTRRATPTATASRTPGTSDCCQCPSSCAEPVNGSCDSNCTVVFGTSCFGEQFCVLHTPTVPTATPTPCAQDNGDGTITDGCTGLTWEKKDQAGGSHEYSARYLWAGTCEDSPSRLCQPDAEAAAACDQATFGDVDCSQCDPEVRCIDPSTSQTAVTVWSWLVELNSGSGFAGHTDWRIPTIGEDGDVAELETILLPACSPPGLCVQPVYNANCSPGAACSVNVPCNDGEVCIQRPDVPNETCQATRGCTVANCSCTWAQYYWSATTEPRGLVWALEVSAGSPVMLDKALRAVVRAVRGEKLPTPPSPTPTPVRTPCPQDAGDGTVLDNCTQLVWEKKDQAGGLHDSRNRYTWAGACSGNTALCQPNASAAAACSAQTGGAQGCAECASGTCIVDPFQHSAVTTIWDWLSQLNEQGLAGYNDWRIPSLGFQGGRAEFETILGPTSPPCDPALPAFDTGCSLGCSISTCSCTAKDNNYWTSTTNLASPGQASSIGFGDCGGFGDGGAKTNAFYARAVRGGL